MIGCQKIDKDTLRIPVERGMQEVPCICIFVFNPFSGFESGLETSVILAVWENGTLIYSENQHSGGPPYYQKQIDADKITEFVQLLRENRLLKNNVIERFYGLDTDTTHIYIAYEDIFISLISWHELIEEDLTWVATEKTEEALEGRNRTDVLANESRRYKNFRKKWELIRENAKYLIRGDEEVTFNPDIHFDSRIESVKF